MGLTAIICGVQEAGRCSSGVEHLIRNETVAGSNPITGFFSFHLIILRPLHTLLLIVPRWLQAQQHRTFGRIF